MIDEAREEEQKKQARNAEMVKASSAVIAYLTRPRSGTGQTVRLAERSGARVFNLAQE